MNMMMYEYDDDIDVTCSSFDVKMYYKHENLYIEYFDTN